MEAVALASHIGTDLIIDVCWPCKVIWFDHMESTSLSAASVIVLFKRIHEARDGDRNLVSLNMRCPTCTGGLKLTNDLGKNGRFSYYRCEMGDGRVISFTQFLREKNFIRSLNAIEIKSLSAQVKQIRCSSCGGSIDLVKDTACSHCGSAISVLDRDAVEKALAALAAKDAQQLRAPDDGQTTRQEIDAIAAVLALRAGNSQPGLPASVYSTYSDNSWLLELASQSVSTDLIQEGIGALVSSLFD